MIFLKKYGACHKLDGILVALVYSQLQDSLERLGHGSEDASMVDQESCVEREGR